MQLELRRILWAGPLTVSICIAAVLALRTAAVAILHPAATFVPLSVAALVFDTVLGATFAIVIFAAKCRYSKDPEREYRSLAAKVLFISFAPDVALAVLHWFGGGWPEACALMTMHVAVWDICVTILPALVARTSPANPDA